MSFSTAAVIFDSGFSQESLSKVTKIAGFVDLITGFMVLGDPFLSDEQRAQILPARSQDPFNHGTVILNTFTEKTPNTPVYLGRVVSPTNNVLRTVWRQQRIARSGWTEAHQLCVQHATRYGLQTVSSFSWGGYESAMDDTGWERYCLGKLVGPGKKGHAVIAAAGEGTPKSSDGSKSRHASWSLGSHQKVSVQVFQATTSEYNVWVKDSELGHSTDRSRNWSFTVWLDGQLVQSYDGTKLGDNFWNNKQQLSFAVVGRGHVEFQCTSKVESASAFDCWIKDGSADFMDHHDSVEVIEPAIFSNVIAVGLDNVNYSPAQGEIGGKPEIIVADDEPHRMLSFHVPDVAIQAIAIMNEAALDCEDLRKLLCCHFGSGSGLVG
ncbi:MAG TPA: hypothetical protein V6C97_33830 [Oculatellaceae cyanobacterium]